MENANFVTLIDPNRRRREALLRHLSAIPRQAKAYEAIEYLPHPLRSSGLFLTFDEGRLLQELLDHLGNAPNPCAIIVLSESLSAGPIVRAVKAGACDYLLWPLNNDCLVEALSTGDRAISSSISVVKSEVRAMSLVSKLTKRENEVIHGVSEGWTSRKIGSHLGISPRTVEVHRQNALKKLNAKNSYEAIRIIYDAENGI